MDKQVTVNSVYNDFWKPILFSDGMDGMIDVDQLKKELYDFWVLMDNVSKVYCHVTGNQISKPLTDVDVVISVVDEYYNEICLEHIEDMKEIENG